MTHGPVGREPLEAALAPELPALRLYARRLAGAGEAEDLVQETLVRALRARGSFDPERALAPWLRRILLRLWIDQRKRADRRAGPLPASESLAARSEPGLESAEELERLLARLAPIERELLTGFHRDGLSIRELAARHALPEGTVKSHLHRARRELARREERP